MQTNAISLPNFDNPVAEMFPINQEQLNIPVQTVYNMIKIRFDNNSNNAV